jgi:hypothetical protein
MTLYALILFSHIAGAFFLFAGLALEWTAIAVFRRGLDTAQARLWISLASTASRLYGPALGVILLSGGYLGAQMRAWDQGWTLVAVITLFVIGLLGAVFTAPRVRAIRKALQENSSTVSTVLQTRLRDPLLQTSVRMRIALVFGVLLLMVSKVSLGPSLITMACATTLGLAIALPAWRRGVPNLQATD